MGYKIIMHANLMECVIRIQRGQINTSFFFSYIVIVTCILIDNAWISMKGCATLIDVQQSTWCDDIAATAHW